LGNGAPAQCSGFDASQERRQALSRAIASGSPASEPNHQGWLIRAIDARGSKTDAIRRVYDDAGRLVSPTDREDRETAFAYDDNGNRAAISFGGGGRLRRQRRPHRPDRGLHLGRRSKPAAELLESLWSSSPRRRGASPMAFSVG
jgi:YD repeat-containing protein